MKTTPISAMCLMSMFALASCEKELDFDYHDIEPLTVIEAGLTPDGLMAAITLTTPMDEPLDRTRLTDASMTLTDLTAGTVRSAVPDADGYFRDAAPGVPGHTYRLTVKRGDAVYTAETAMYAAVTIESLEFSWIKMPYDHVAVLQGKFACAPGATEQCYWIKLYRNGEIYRWAAMDDRGATSGVCTFTVFTTRRDTSEEDDDTVLRDGDVVTCTVSTVSRPMHDYLEALQNGSNGPPMYTGARCLGYFMATSPVSRSIVFHPDQIPGYE